VLAVRPAALLRRPGLAAYNVIYTEMLREVCRMTGSKGKIDLSIHDVEQILATGFIEHDKHHNQKKGSRTLGFSLRVVRCSHDFDWKGQMKALMPDVEEVHHAGGSYFRLSLSKARPPLRGGLCYYIPDRRTIVMDSDNNLCRLIERKVAPAPLAACAEGWKRVERDLLAIAADVRGLDVFDMLDPKDPDEASWGVILRNSTWITVGLRDSAACAIDACAECTTPERAHKVHQRLAAMLERTKASVSGATAVKADVVKAMSLARELLASADPQCQGSRIEVHFTAKQGFEEGLKACMGVELDPDGKPVPARR
jgi:hypothetical protein